MTFDAWYCRRCRRIAKTEPAAVILTMKTRCACERPLLPLQPTRVTM